jgi:hypothetical protein
MVWAESGMKRSRREAARLEKQEPANVLLRYEWESKEWKIHIISNSLQLPLCLWQAFNICEPHTDRIDIEQLKFIVIQATVGTRQIVNVSLVSKTQQGPGTYTQQCYCSFCFVVVVIIIIAVLEIRPMFCAH